MAAHHSAGSNPQESSITASLELVTRAQAGDRRARERLFTRYYPRVFRVVRARLGEKLRGLEDPDDIVQNTFLAATGALGHLEAREEAGLINWFSRIVENQIRDAFKHHYAQKRDAALRVPLEHADPVSGERCIDPPDRSGSPLDRITDAELARILDECIAELPHEEREAIVLRDHAGASWGFISQELERPTENAARELHRRAQLRLMDAFRRRTNGPG